MDIVSIIKRGGIGVLATDTIYGVVGRALNKKTVDRIYTVRKRNPAKPFIILISSIADLKKFGVRLDVATKKILNRIWPAKVSVILPCVQNKFRYLHRGMKTLAFRLPANARLRSLLGKTGPLVAPSANPEGLVPATTIAQAKQYFGDSVDFYENRGRRMGAPSALVNINKGIMTVLRRGAIKV